MHKNRSRILPITPVRFSSNYQRGPPGSLPRWTHLVQESPSTTSTSEQIDELDETPPIVVVKRRRQKRSKTPSRSNPPIPQVMVQPPTPFLEPPAPAQSVQPNNSLLLPSRPIKFMKCLQPREGSPLSEKAERVKKKAERNEAKRRKAVERFLCVEIVVQKDNATSSEPDAQMDSAVSENSTTEVQGDKPSEEVKKRKRGPEDLSHESRIQPSEDPQNVPAPPLTKKRKRRINVQTEDTSIPQECSAGQEKVASSNSTSVEKKGRKSKAKRTSLVTTDNSSPSPSKSASLGFTGSSPPVEINDGVLPSSDDTLIPDSDECQWAKPEDTSSRLLLLQKDPAVAESMQAFCKLPIEECKDFFTAISMEDWAIPSAIKSRFDNIAKQLFRDVSEEMLFKDRAMNDFRFFLYLMKNPKEVGMTRNFAKNLIKLTKMRSAWGRSIDEARRDIVTRVKASIENNDPLSVLVASLYGDKTNENHANMAVVLRHVLRSKGRNKKFFNNVDKKLLKIRASSKPTRSYHFLMDADAVNLHDTPEAKS